MESEKQNLDIKYYDSEFANDGISMLNEDCLIRIFEFLPIADRVRVERVCKRWKEKAQASWRHFRILNFSRESWGSFKGVLDNEIFRKVLHRCHNSITHIIARDYAMVEHVKNIHLIPELCPNLKYATLNGFILSELFLTQLPLCTKIEEISLNCATQICTDDAFGSLVSSLQNLRSITIVSEDRRDTDKNLTGQFLKMANAESIQEVHFYGCCNIKIIVICNIIQNFKNLHTITLSKMFFEANYDNYWILTRTQSLNIKKLDVSWSSSEELGTGINDKFLRGLTDNLCKRIVVLNVRGNEAITDAGLSEIAQLDKLEELDASELPLVSTIGMFCRTSTLKRLQCEKTNIKNRDVVRLLGSLDKLEYLDLSYCPNISKDFLKYLVEIINLRDNDTTVTIVLIQTQIKVSDLPTLSRVKFII